jgi:hypothetical protein
VRRNHELRSPRLLTVASTGGEAGSLT